jgi:hypothetical protein
LSAVGRAEEDPRSIAFKRELHVASQPLEQIVPRATQSPAETRQHWDGGELRPALDFLEITPAHIGFLGRRYLSISRSRASNCFQVPSESAGGDLQRNGRVKGHQAAAVFHCHRQQIGIGHLLVASEPAAIEQRSIR